MVYLHSWNSVGAKKVGVGYLAESFPKTYRSVLPPSWLPSNRAWKTAPGVCDIHRSCAGKMNTTKYLVPNKHETDVVAGVSRVQRWAGGMVCFPLTVTYFLVLL